MKIASYGYKLVIFCFAIFFISLLASNFYPGLLLKIITFILGIVSIFNLYFFRDPERRVPADKNAVLSPADGKVVLIKDVEEPDFIQGPAKQISIFLSVFNVHVNRSPVSGKVEYYRYKEGKFIAAFNHAASEDNEQTIIGITSENGKVLFKQIAGLIARRIVCNLSAGDHTRQGERMGMIKYGSRVDVFVPEGTTITVKNGDTVKGGLSILAEFSE